MIGAAQGQLGSVVMFGVIAWMMANTSSTQVGVAPEAIRGVEFCMDVGMDVLLLAAFGGVVMLRAR